MEAQARFRADWLREGFRSSCPYMDSLVHLSTPLGQRWSPRNLPLCASVAWTSEGLPRNFDHLSKTVYRGQVTLDAKSAGTRRCLSFVALKLPPDVACQDS